MKNQMNSLNILVCALSLVLVTPKSHAQDHEGNGIIFAQQELLKWIMDGSGPQQLAFGNQVSASGYQDQMTDLIEKTVINTVPVRQFEPGTGKEVTCQFQSNPKAKSDKSKTKGSKVLVCNSKRIQKQPKDSQILMLHQNFARKLKIEKGTEVSSQVSDFLTQEIDGRLNRTKEDRDDFLTSTQKSEVLNAIDGDCADTWCEGKYNYQFPKLTCSKESKSCHLEIIEQNVIDPPSENDPPTYTWHRTINCEIKNVKNYFDLVIDNGFEEKEAVYVQVTECISPGLFDKK